MDHDPPDGRTATVATTSAVVTLLERLADQGVIVRLRRGQLVVDAPDVVGDGELLRELRDRDAEVVSLLALDPGVQQAPPSDSGEATAFAATDLQSAYRIGEYDFYDLHTPAFVAQGYAIKGLDLDRLRVALARVVASHDALRLIAVDEDKQSVATLSPGWAPTVICHGDADDDARSACLARCERAHELLEEPDTGPQVACEVHCGRHTSFVVIAMRLYALDARSIGLVSRDIGAAYARLDAVAERTQPGGFARYARAAEARRASQSYRNSIAYWQRRARAVTTGPVLPENPHRRLQRSRAQFGRVEYRLPRSAWIALQEHARSHEVSLNVALFTAYTDVLRRWSTRSRFAVTLLVSARPWLLDDGLENCVGNFGTTLLWEDSGQGATFHERASRLQQQLVRDLSHCQVSGIEVLRRARRTAGSLGNVPYVFASSLDTDDGARLSHQVEADGWEVIFKSMHTPQVVLDHQVSEEDGLLRCNFDYVHGMFPADLVEELAIYHEHVLLELSTSAQSWSCHGSPALPDQLVRTRTRVNSTYRCTSSDHPFLEQFDARASKHPLHPAFFTLHGELDYRALRERAKAVADLLTPHRASPRPLVGLLAEKSIDQYVAAFAVAAAGSPYVPLNIEWPRRRIQHFLAQAGIRLVLVDAAGERILAGHSDDTALLRIDQARATASDDGAGPFAVASPDALAYVMFTSGSTGVPKGVAIPNSALMNTVADVCERFGFDGSDRILSLSELNFDLSAFDLFGALYSGGTVVIPRHSAHPDVEHWIECLRSREVTVWNTVPALMEMLLDYAGDDAAEALASLRLIMLSGDWVPPALPSRIREANPAIEVVALGGATEASIWSNYHVTRGPERGWTSVPYGTPLANQRYHVLDDALHDCPNWVPGELYIAGDGLADGYYRLPALTAQRFVVNPRSGERLYRTGDHGRYRPDGTLEFLGRQDSQTKLNGYRIDLLEIENELMSEPGVRAAACLVHGTAGRQGIAAFVASDETPDCDRMRERLSRTLPRYAVPATIQAVESIPLTTNGKRDVDALRAIVTLERSRPSSEVLAPRTAMEETLAELWTAVCGDHVRSVDDDFFSIGGSSLLAVRLLHRIEQTFGVRLALSSLFDHSTISSQATAIAARLSDAPPEVVPVRTGGDAAIVVFHAVGGHILAYRDLITALPTTYAVYGIESPSPEMLPSTLDELAARYARNLAAAGLTRAVHLVGWSMGGVLALEVARHLDTRNAVPASITLIDSFMSGTPESRLGAESMMRGFMRNYTEGAVDPPVDASEVDTLADILRAAGRLAPQDTAEELDQLYATYSGLTARLLGHRVAGTPCAPVQVLQAGSQDPSAFDGLTPLDPGLIGGPERHLVLDEDHFSIMRGDGARLVAHHIAEFARAQVVEAGAV